jgi:glycosyltransferase involved in cell wall biosynthesis
MSSVGIVIPCYMYGHFLEECVQSVLDEQPGVEVRAVIIDNASTDDSAHVAGAIARRDARVDVIVHETNMGHIASINEGLEALADCDYLVILAADDMLTPGSLGRAVALLEEYPNVGFCYGHPLHFHHPGSKPPARTIATGYTVWPGHWWLERRFREGTGCVSSPEVVMRTSVQRKVGGYDPTLPHTCDIAMWMRMAAYADVGYIRGADQAYFRRHGRNMSMTRFSSQLEDIRARRAAFESVITTCGDLLPNGGKDLDSIVHRRLARIALRFAYRAYDRKRTEKVPVDKLIQFAAETWPEYEQLPEYRSLRLRQSIGTKAMPYLQPLILSAVIDKGRNRLWWRSWRRNGI